MNPFFTFSRLVVIVGNYGNNCLQFTIENYSDRAFETKTCCETYFLIFHMPSS